MPKTAVIFSPKFYQHNPGKTHPESAKRLKAIVNELCNSSLSKSKQWQFVSPEKAAIENVELVHDRNYINFIETVCRSGGGVLDSGDTVASLRSFDVALYAVGGTIKAVNLVMKKEYENAFALVRPPGHHAEKFRAYGFCIFNNVAIATKYLLKKYKLKRVAILDIDSHHGNGTQEIFYETNKVLYISLHENPKIFPKTGFIGEIGEADGLGYNVNIPLPFKTGDQIYLKAMQEIAIPIMHQYKPQFILVSAGLDGHYTDPVGSLSLSALCYKRVYGLIVKLASKTCNERLVSVLEGGYSRRFIGKIAATAIGEMSYSNYEVNDKVPLIDNHIIQKGKKILEKVTKVQSNFWDLG